MTVSWRPDAHFVITRFGIGVTDEPWYDHRLELLRAVPYASLAAQTSQQFHWLVIVDTAMPAAARRRLDALLAVHPNFHVVPVDPTAQRRMTLGTLDWLWDAALDHVLAEELIGDVGEYVVTSIIDDDDAWHVTVVETVNRLLFGQFVARLAHADRISPTFGGLLVSHGNGAAMTFPDGLQWNVVDDRHGARRYPWHSMTGFVVSRCSSGVAATSARHDMVGQFATIPAFRIAELTSPHPMWLYVRHPDAMSVQLTDDDYGAPVHASTASLHRALVAQFGIDLDGVERYRTRWTARDPGPGSNVLAPHRRLDAQYRITAHNRLLDALDRRIPHAAGAQRDALRRRRANAVAAREVAVRSLRGAPAD